MSEPKAFASLSTGLLARKGGARPAMRPQGYGQMGTSLDDLGWNDMGFEAPKPVIAHRDGSHDGFGQTVTESATSHLAGLTPVGGGVNHQHHDSHEHDEDEIDSTAELMEATPQSNQQTPESATGLLPTTDQAQAVIAAEKTPHTSKTTKRPTSSRRKVLGAATKAQFTLRLEAERHLRLRLACAVAGKSAQHLLTQAIDEMLTKMPELDKLAKHAKNTRK